ncbi:uncharacterized protein LOC119680820 [Teleopsis dalmanni]|uniref:uncharacterized protein LOC119680820 n=1 Tax=Teleopsis dalmanni TaxID=139649 RepID=UPI0018CFDF8F|nr:uncharacterized protein LOC119680820 [Teleopsis dalmanni]
MPPIQMTIGQLVQLALGTPNITKFNMALLHTALNFIMKKLHCEEDKIQLEGIVFEKLNDRLESSLISAIPIINEGIDIFTTNLKLLDEIEECIQSAENKLNFHVIDSCYKNMENIEGLHTIVDKESEIAVSLLQNEDFLKWLCRTLTAPTVDRLNVIGKKIDHLGSEFYSFSYRISEEYADAKLLPIVLQKLYNLKNLIANNHKNFISAMTELHWILNAKMDVSHIPPFKKEFFAALKEIDDMLKDMKIGKAAGVIQRCKNLDHTTVITEEAETSSDEENMSVETKLSEINNDVLLNEKAECGCGEEKEDDIIFLKGIDDTIYRIG